MKALTKMIALNAAVRKYAVAQEGARRFHPEVLGKDVNPEHSLGDFLVMMSKAQTAKLSVDRDAGRGRLESQYKAVRTVGGLGTPGVSITKTALSVSGGGPVGGYLVPQELLFGLMASVWEHSILRPRAFVQPMSSAVLQMPYVDVSQGALGVGAAPWFGGVILYWQSEATPYNETEPSWRSLELRAHNLGGLAYASNALLLDAGEGLESYLHHLFGGAVAWYEDFAFLVGNGVGKPLGVYQSGGVIAVNRQVAGTFVLNDSATMLSKLIPYSFGTAIWVVHPSVLVKLTQILSAGGQSAWVANEQTQGVARGQVGHLHSHPVFVSEKLATVGNSGDVLLFDPTLYVIGDRGEIEINVSAEVPAAFLSNQSAWAVNSYVDGRTWFNKTITLQDGSVSSGYIALN